MANKLSIEKINVGMGLAQIKTGELFEVIEIDLMAKKATLKSASGDEKVVSKATLERWYRELSSEEVIKFENMTKTEENGGSQDEVHESDESEQTEANEDCENADVADEGDENAAEAEQSGVEATETSESGGENKSGETEGVAEQPAEQPADDNSGNDGEPESGAGGQLDQNGGSSDQDGGDAEGIEPPVNPSNAGNDKDKAKAGKQNDDGAKKNAALMKVRQTIIDTILADSDSIQLKRTGGYDVLKEKHNFAEITRGTNRFNVSVMSKCLTEDQINKVKINPASFGWSIDADFTVFDEGDIETAVQLIRQSRAYRLAHPVTRKKKNVNADKAK